MHDMIRTLLAIESSTDWLSVALLRGEEVLILQEHQDSRQHASALLPTIDAVLSQAGLGLDDLDAIGVSTGPGSFTSLRIGLATVKGLGFERELLGVGVSTLEAMALSVLEDNARVAPGRVVAVLDARRGEWYAGGWSRSGDPGSLPIATLSEGLYAPRQLAEDLDAGTIVMTPEPEEWRRAFQEASVRLADVVEGRAARPRADWVGRLAQRRLNVGEGAAVSTLEARYLRRAEAEAKRLGGPVEEGEVARLDD
jgi:tRNA threonylcarbamoyladenosine biosynthesis protein TsaB